MTDHHVQHQRIYGGIAGAEPQSLQLVVWRNLGKLTQVAAQEIRYCTLHVIEIVLDPF